MGVWEQILANIKDAPWASVVGVSLGVLQILCAAGVVALYLSPETQGAWCKAIELATGGAAVGALTTFRPPWIPPR
jgi:hypothetical protein